MAGVNQSVCLGVLLSFEFDSEVILESYSDGETHRHHGSQQNVAVGVNVQYGGSEHGQDVKNVVSQYVDRVAEGGVLAVESPSCIEVDHTNCTVR